jgi:transposase
MAEATPREETSSEVIARLTEELKQSRLENQALREKIDQLLKRLFGAQSEKLDPAQLQMLLKGIIEPPKSPEPVAAEEPRRSTVPSPPRKPSQPRIPANTEVVEEVIVPAEVQAHPQAWRCMGEEVTEQLDFEPGRFFKRRIVRRKYVRLDAPLSPPVIAPLQTLQDRCIAAPGLIAAIIVGKYCDHLPLYRQQQILSTRYRVELPRQTMAQWMGLAAHWLKPIYDLIRKDVLAGGYVQVDETPIEYLAPGHGSTKLGYLWTCKRPGGDTVFYWSTSRGAKTLDAIFPENWKGTVQCDGYAAYPSFARKREKEAEVTLSGCWAHARRHLYEARESAPRVAGWLLGQIRQLYEIEAALRYSRAGPALRQAERSARSAPILRRIHAAILRLRERYLPQSGMGQAFAYILEQWPSLLRFVEDGRLEIDNNLVENAIRPTALGKKNWLFIGADNAGERGAILYTIVECCRRRGLDPYAYLRDVLTGLPKMTMRDAGHLTPQAWQMAQRAMQHRQAA